MNSFDQQLLIAKKKQRLLYVWVFTLLLIGVFIILTIIIASRGTRIVIKPDDAAAQSSVRLNGGISVIIGILEKS
jgi:Flp pilus assembly protein protease CpaA